MTAERIDYVAAMLENLTANVQVIAEGHIALVDGLAQLNSKFDRLETKVNGIEVKVDVLTTRIDRLETKVNGIEVKVDILTTRIDRLETKVDGLEVFASDAQRRLQRIEGHLDLNGAHRPSPRRKATRASTAKRHKKN